MKLKLPDTNLILSEATNKACEIACDAADRIMDIYDTDFSVEEKSDLSPLTTADMASHEAICSQLTEFTPDIPILSEESADISYSERKNWNHYWLVDPLDGTREFIKRNGEFTVNIALIYQHNPVLGVIHIPISGITYLASHGQGAFKQMPGKAPEKIRVKQTMLDTITVAGSRSHGSEKQKTFINNLGKTKLIAIGSSLKFCLVAEGKVDIYRRFGPTSEWDTAAAQCIVEEAGGIVANTSLERLQYNTKESLVNPDFLAIADCSINWREYLP